LNEYTKTAKRIAKTPLGKKTEPKRCRLSAGLPLRFAYDRVMPNNNEPREVIKAKMKNVV
jgi:hypothetical protein